MFIKGTETCVNLCRDVLLLEHLPTIKKSNVCGEMFIVVWHQHFIYHLEEFCNLDPLSETDLIVLHYVRINQCLDEFLESWNRHPLRTKRS